MLHLASTLLISAIVALGPAAPQEPRPFEPPGEAIAYFANLEESWRDASRLHQLQRLNELLADDFQAWSDFGWPSRDRLLAWADPKSGLISFPTTIESLRIFRDGNDVVCAGDTCLAPGFMSSVDLCPPVSFISEWSWRGGRWRLTALFTYARANQDCVHRIQ